MEPKSTRSVVLGLGSNVGSREAFLRASRDLLALNDALDVVSTSRVYETPPLGPAGQRDYLNAAIHLHSDRSPEAILAIARSVEVDLGRERRERWGPRTIDLDILWIDGLVHTTPGLTVPHGELLSRAFALAPLVELVPDATDPHSQTRYRDALDALPPASPRAPRELGEAFETIVLEHTADEGFIVRARDRSDVLAAAAEALGALVVNPTSVAARQRRIVEASAQDGAWLSDDERLFAWLAEVNYYVDAQRFAVRRAVVFEDGDAKVRGALYGEPIDEARHDVKGAIKAVTYHAMEIGPTEHGDYRAQVVVDV
jgi:2-amino-4-hydroxy-6-hydroxymethyldihydropteridine diphosphokinase